MLKPSGWLYIKTVYLCAISPAGGDGWMNSSVGAEVKFVVSDPPSKRTSEAPDRLGWYQCRNWTRVEGSEGVVTSWSIMKTM
jgi:hypothetical protein